MGFFGWIILGALSGWIASKIMNRDKQMGGCANIVVGVIGGSIGGWIGNQLGWGGIHSFSLYSLAMAIVGSVILLAILGFIWNNRG